MLASIVKEEMGSSFPNFHEQFGELILPQVFVNGKAWWKIPLTSMSSRKEG